MAPNDVSSADNAAAFKLPSLVQNCLSLSSSLARHNPFSIGPPAKKSPNLILQPPNYAVFRELHASFASAALDFLGFLRFLASENSPLVEKFLSFSGDFSRHFSQIQCWNARNANSLSNHNFAAVLPGGDSVAGLVVANGILNFLNIYNTLLIVRLVLTWFPNSPPAIVSPLSTLCDPYLNIFRGIIPPLGGTLDLSPILAFLVLNAFTSAAAALPAELPGSTSSQAIRLSGLGFTDLTTSQKKWMRRLCGNKSKSSTPSS